MPATARIPAATDVLRAAASEASSCYHCGLPNPPGRRWLAELMGAERAFCCAGCLAVAQTIHAAGLDGFYAARTAALARPDGRADDDEWVRHDDSAAAAGLVRELPEGRVEASLLLEGLTCGACVWLIEAWLARQPGVERAQVNFATRRATVAWRRDRRGCRRCFAPWRRSATARTLTTRHAARRSPWASAARCCCECRWRCSA